MKTPTVYLKGVWAALHKQGLSRAEINREYARKRSRLLRKKYLSIMRKIQIEKQRIYLSKPENRFKRNARRKVEYEIKMGRIKKGVCGKPKCQNKNTQAHHDDYDKRLEIKWFCPLHHREYERNLTKTK